MTNIDFLLNRIELKVKELVLLLKKNEEELIKFKNENTILKEQLEDKKDRIKELEENINFSNLAKTIDNKTDNKTDNKALTELIDEMLREIDISIQRLNN